MSTLFTIIAFILGASFGSFASVIIHRIHNQEKGILLGRSKCPNCQKVLKALHLIPVVSWVAQKGRCAFCKKDISSHYPILELFFGLAFAFVYSQFPAHLGASIPQLAFYLISISFLLLIFFYDLIYKEIPDSFSLTAIIITLLAKLISPELLPSLSSMLIGAAIVGGFFLIQFLVSKGTWVGGGDIRLGALMGVLLGWQHGITALILAYLLGGVISILLLIKGKVRGKTEIAFGPFLVTATFIVLFWGDSLIDWYLNAFLI